MSGKKSEIAKIKWHGVAGIEQAHSLRDELIESFKKAPEVRLDISEVEDIDITGIQIVISAKKEADKLGKKFFITGKIPDAIQQFTAASSISLESYVSPEDEVMKDA